MWKWKGGRTRQKPAPWGELIGGPIAGPSRPEEPNGPTPEGVATGGSKQENCSTERTDCQGGLWGGGVRGATSGTGALRGLMPGATCCRRLRGSTLTPSFPWACAPRLSAGAASRLDWKPWAGARGIDPIDIVAPNDVPYFLGKPLLRGMAPGARCCRRLRGSTLTPRFPWAYAHG